jgi:DNA-directed RNA polymerase subunit beta'
VLGLYYLTKAKVGAKGEGRVFANIEEVLMALEAKQVETLSPIRLRYTGPVLDMTVAYDDQDLCTPRRWSSTSSSSTPRSAAPS